ncbi:hypothetical protein [Flavobacterium anhuiense]|uniref:hypothetical protein n=1 Tax=Flavobacterium anhuiense TaxID=459526 RepID=UPI003D97C13F
MKYCILMLVLIACSCANTDNIKLKPIVSQEYVFIKPYKKNRNDSVILDLPLEYKLINNSSKKIDNSIFYISHNHGMLRDLDDYFIFEKNEYYSNKILNTKRSINSNDTLHLFIRENYLIISKNEATKIFRKYKIDESLIDTNEKVKIAKFYKFKIENPRIIANLKSNKDSLIISNFCKGELISVNRIRINW